LRRHLLQSYSALGFAPATVATRLRLPPFDLLRGRFVPSTAILQQIQRGVVRLRPAINQIDADSVCYTDGTRAPADAIVFCTGYQLSLPFLEPDVLPIEGRHTVRLYKQVFHPVLENLACLALCGVTGAVFPVAEMQARWVARVFAGKMPLPPPAERVRWIEAYFAAHARAGTNPMRLELAKYLDDLAVGLGVYPRFLRHPALLSRLLFGPYLAAQYRLDGPGHSPRARDILTGKVK
jgi:dimethylaniline monooxygenase (N-oxide forming)